MIIRVLLSAVTLTCALSQMMPVMPPASGVDQGTVSYSELLALMAMRNQLPLGDQQYTLLNLTEGKPLPRVPPTSSYPVEAPVPRDAQMASAMLKLPHFSAPMPSLPGVEQVMSAGKAIQKASPSQQPISQADIEKAITSAINAVLPSAVESALKAAVPARPKVSQTDIQSAIQAAVNTALPAPKPPAPSSSSLDIKSMIEAAVMSAINGTGVSVADNGPPPLCTGTCPPNWLKTVHGFTGNMKPDNPMCKYKKFMSPCDKPNSPCKSGYSCCPVSCLETIVHCYTGPTIKYACLPDDVTPWWPEMVQTYMQANGMGMGMGLGSAGGMGGPMAGLMGGGMNQMMSGLMGGMMGLG